MNSQNDKFEQMKLWHLESVVRKALETPEDKKRWKEHIAWCMQFDSDNSEIVSAAFKKDWSLIEKVVKEKSDLIKLKKKFGIK